MNLRKVILFFLLFSSCLLFSGSILAEMSDQEKLEFIESLVEPSQKKRVFYRWQDEKSRNELLEAGEMTLKLYTDFMSRLPNSYEGGGIYVSEDIASSSTKYGKTLIQVEVDLGYRFLDFSDKKVQRQLKRKGISIEDVYRLKPKVALRGHSIVWWMTKDPTKGYYDNPYWDRNPWWILKAREGVQFKPFSSRGISLRDLEKAYDKIGQKGKDFFKNSIREDILSRAEKSADVYASSLVEIVEETYGRAYVAEAIEPYIQHIEFQNAGNGIRWLKNAGKYLSEPHKRAIIQNTLPLITSEEELEIFKNYLSNSEYEEALRRFQIRAQNSFGEKASNRIRLTCLKVWETTRTFVKAAPGAILRTIKSPEAKIRAGNGSSKEVSSPQNIPEKKKIISEEDRTVIIDDNSTTETVTVAPLKNIESYGDRIIGWRSTSEYILDSNGKKIGFFKETGYPTNEVLTYELCVSIGCRVVPETKYAEFGKRTGSYQKFVEGVTRLNLDPSSRDVYIEALKNPDSTIRQDFDEMTILDLIGGAQDRNEGNYIT